VCFIYATSFYLITFVWRSLATEAWNRGLLVALVFNAVVELAWLLTAVVELLREIVAGLPSGSHDVAAIVAVVVSASTLALLALTNLSYVMV
jgi:hypothetical protein